MNILQAFATLLIIFFSSCQPPPEKLETTEDWDEYIEIEMEDQKIPALSAIIFNKDKILHEAYFGQSNIQQNATLGANDVFLVASISKVVTATALLQLYEQGKFAMSDPINNYLPYNVAIPNYTSTDITFEMLLTHTAAIGDGDALDNQYYYGMDSPVALDSFLKTYFTAGAANYNATQNFKNFAPGTAISYSNVGSALIAVLVEQLSGINFNTYCKQNIFIPLGMNNTFWRLDEITNNTIVQPYDYVSGNYNPIQNYTNTDYPNGGLRTNVGDLYLLLSALAQGGKANNGHQVLQAATVQNMHRPQVPNIDDTMGWHLFLVDETNNIWGHDGGEQGVVTIMGFNPSNGVGVILLANQGEAELDDMLVDSYLLGLEL